MAQSTDPTKASTAAYLDDIAGRTALHRLAAYDDRRLSSLSGKDLQLVDDAVQALVMPIYRERQRRRETPRGKGKLRLVAQGGYLTEAGQRHVSALKGLATRRARRVTE